MFPPGLVKRAERWQTYFSTDVSASPQGGASDKNPGQSAFDNERALPPFPPWKGSWGGGWRSATTRKLPSIVADSVKQGTKGKRQNRKLGRSGGDDRRCRGKGGAHKASEWRGGEGEGKNSCRIPPGSPFHTPDATTSQRFRPQKIPLSHSNVTKDDSRPSSPSPSVAPKRKRKSSPN